MEKNRSKINALIMAIEEVSDLLQHSQQVEPKDSDFINEIESNVNTLKEMLNELQSDSQET